MTKYVVVGLVLFAMAMVFGAVIGKTMSVESILQFALALFAFKMAVEIADKS